MPMIGGTQHQGVEGGVVQCAAKVFDGLGTSARGAGGRVYMLAEDTFVEVADVFDLDIRAAAKLFEQVAAPPSDTGDADHNPIIRRRTGPRGERSGAGGKRDTRGGGTRCQKFASVHDGVLPTGEIFDRPGVGPARLFAERAPIIPHSPGGCEFLTTGNDAWRLFDVARQCMLFVVARRACPARRRGVARCEKQIGIAIGVHLE